MAFSEVNSKKLAFLLIHGTHEGELRKFFVDTKMQLIQKGAKVQNLPPGRDERIRTISEKLSRKTDDILRAWFQKNILLTAPMSEEDVLMFLETYFDEATLPGSEAQQICRSALTNLFSDLPDPKLLELLHRPMGPPTPEGIPTSDGQGARPAAEASVLFSPQVQAEGPEQPPGAPAKVPALQGFQLSELLASVIANDESAIDNALAPFPEPTRLLVDSLLQLRNGDLIAARENLANLPQSGPEAELLQDALARASHHRSVSAIPAGIRVANPAPVEGNLEETQCEIIGIYTNETTTGAVFVTPLFLVIEGQLRSLTGEDRDRLFPESGAVMTKRSLLRRALRRGDLVHWHVSERDGVEGRTRFHMEAELNGLTRVVHLHLPSSDPDEVRNRIKSYSTTGRSQSGQPVLFLLSDGVAIASPKGVDTSRDEAFDQPWHAWSSLTTWLIEGNQYCLDLSTALASTIDLSTIDATFKRLLKNLESEQKLKLSKEQRREIAELIRHELGSEVSFRARRVAASLDQMSINDTDLGMVLTLLGSHKDVRQRVDELVKKEAEERQVEKAGLLAEIAALKKKKADLEKERREIERLNRDQVTSTSALVREAFERSIREGATTLAKAEIFRLLAGAKHEHQKQELSPAASKVDDLSRRPSLSQSEVKASLSVLGFNARKATILSAVSEVAASSGVVLTLRGSLAGQCAQILARQGRERVAHIEIPMGLTSSEMLRQRLATVSESQAVVVLNADLSPLEIYGTDLLDSLFQQAMSGAVSPRPMFVACQGGDFSLPTPQVFRMVSLFVDIESLWDEEDQLLDDVDSESINILKPLQKRVFDALTGVDPSIRDHVERALVRAMKIY